MLSTKLTRALLCLPGAAAVSGQVDGKRDKGRKRGCYYSGCYINLHQVIPLFTRSLAMGSRERGKKRKGKRRHQHGRVLFSLCQTAFGRAPGNNNIILYMLYILSLSRKWSPARVLWNICWRLCYYYFFLYS